MIMNDFLARKELNGYYIFDKRERRVFYIGNENEKDLSNYENININTVVYDKYKNEVPEDLKNSVILAPNRVYLEITRNCQLNCNFCYNKSGYNNGGARGEMNLDELKRLINQMERTGIFELRITGGEPTISENLIPLFDYAADKNCFYISLATNGVWSGDIKAKLLERIDFLDDIIISLEGGKKHNDKIRGEGSFDKALGTIKQLKQKGARKVRINTVVTKESATEENLRELMQIVKDNDLLLINFILPRPFGRGEKLDLLDKESLNKIDILINRLKEEYKIKTVMDIDLHSKNLLPKHPVISKLESCNAGKEFLFISPYGEVFPCSVSPVYNNSAQDKAMFTAGNIRQTPLIEIWHKSPVWTPFRYPKLNKPQKCLTCGYYGKKCFGSCPFGSYAENGTLNGEDPYCFCDLI